MLGWIWFDFDKSEFGKPFLRIWNSAYFLVGLDTYVFPRVPLVILFIQSFHLDEFFYGHAPIFILLLAHWSDVLITKSSLIGYTASIMLIGSTQILVSICISIACIILIGCLMSVVYLCTSAPLLTPIETILCGSWIFILLKTSGIILCRLGVRLNLLFAVGFLGVWLWCLCHL